MGIEIEEGVRDGDRGVLGIYIEGMLGIKIEEVLIKDSEGCKG